MDNFMKISVVWTRLARIISGSTYKESEGIMSSLSPFCSPLLGGGEEFFFFNLNFILKICLKEHISLAVQTNQPTKSFGISSEHGNRNRVN